MAKKVTITKGENIVKPEIPEREKRLKKYFCNGMAVFASSREEAISLINK